MIIQLPTRTDRTSTPSETPAPVISMLDRWAEMEAERPVWAVAEVMCVLCMYEGFAAVHQSHGAFVECLQCEREAMHVVSYIEGHPEL